MVRSKTESRTGSNGPTELEFFSVGPVRRPFHRDRTDRTELELFFGRICGVYLSIEIYGYTRTPLVVCTSLSSTSTCYRLPSYRTLSTQPARTNNKQKIKKFIFWRNDAAQQQPNFSFRAFEIHDMTDLFIIYIFLLLHDFYY